MPSFYERRFGSGTQKAAKYAAKTAALAAAETQVLQQVLAMPKGRGANFYELSDDEVELLLWAIGKATYVGNWHAPIFTANELQALIEKLERREGDER